MIAEFFINLLQINFVGRIAVYSVAFLLISAAFVIPIKARPQENEKIMLRVYGLENHEKILSIPKQKAKEIEEAMKELKMKLYGCDTEKQILLSAQEILMKFNHVNVLSREDARKLYSILREKNIERERINLSSIDNESNFLCFVAGKTNITAFRGEIWATFARTWIVTVETLYLLSAWTH